MKLIVGLGNPGKEYEHTRHNVGYDCLDFYLESKKIQEKWSKKFDGQILETIIEGEKVLFLKPHTFMNLSGQSVRKAMDYYKIDVDDILVIADDMDLLLGNFKLKPYGSCAGHNGLRNIEENLGSSRYKRLKIGISKVDGDKKKDYVLGHFSTEESNSLKELFPHLCEVIDDYFHLAFSDLMSKYNRKNR